MTGFVVDASVAVKWVVSEEFSDRAVLLLSSDKPLLAPELLYLEAANALWKMMRRGNFTEKDLHEALAALADAPVVVAGSIKELMPAAARLARELDHPVYDCTYLALALQQDRPVVTADRRFYNVVRQHPYLAAHIVHLGTLN